MKIQFFAALLAVVSISSASADVILFQDDFSSDTLATGYATQGVNYNATPQTVTLQRGYTEGVNYLEVSEVFGLATAGSTQLTVSFNYAFGTAMYGSAFVVEYNDNTGTGWQTIGTVNYTGTNANDDSLAANTYSITISEGAIYNFTDSAAIRLRASSGTGGKGYHIDNLTILVDTAGEASKATVILISSVSLWLVLSSAFLYWGETRKSCASEQANK